MNNLQANTFENLDKIGKVLRKIQFTKSKRGPNLVIKNSATRKILGSMDLMYYYYRKDNNGKT